MQSAVRLTRRVCTYRLCLIQILSRRCHFGFSTLCHQPTSRQKKHVDAGSAAGAGCVALVTLDYTYNTIHNNELSMCYISVHTYLAAAESGVVSLNFCRYLTLYSTSSDSCSQSLYFCTVILLYREVGSCCTLASAGPLHITHHNFGNC